MDEDHEDFVDSLGPAFLGLQLYRLLRVIDEQGTQALSRAPTPLPSRVASTLMVLIRCGPSSLTQIGRRLGMPHQLVAQRTKLLQEAGLIRYVPDPSDGRRTFMHLTPEGNKAAQKLQETVAATEKVYADVFGEIGIDLFEGLVAFRRALEVASIGLRIEDLGTAPRKQRRRAKGGA